MFRKIDLVVTHPLTQERYNVVATMVEDGSAEEKTVLDHYDLKQSENYVIRLQVPKYDKKAVARVPVSTEVLHAYPFLTFVQYASQQVCEQIFQLPSKMASGSMH